MLPLKKILAPTDFSEPSYIALNQALELAEHFGAELCLLHVVPFLPATPPDLGIGFLAINDVASDAQRLQHAMQHLQKIAAARVPSNIKTRCEVKMGFADKEIACVAEDEHFDWIVIATHGLSGWRHLVFGSVAEAIVRHAHCPVLTVHTAPVAAKLDEKLLEKQEVGPNYESTRLLRA
jgi:nucleotide-binding universal stress UspA family protein